MIELKVVRSSGVSRSDFNLKHNDWGVEVRPLIFATIHRHSTTTKKAGGGGDHNPK